MMGQVPAIRLESPPEIYMVADHVHIVDRIAGAVVVHRIYPIAVIDQLAQRAAGVAAAAEMVGQIAGAGRRRRKRT